MNKKDKILITGATGMVGSNLYKKLSILGYKNVVALGVNYERVDLTKEEDVFNLFYKEKPEYVFMIAAVVGGIQFNIENPVKMLEDNIRINTNLFRMCKEFKVKKTLYLGSSCMYPKECQQPMKEEYLMTGLLEPTNEGYAISKIVGLKLAEYFNKQYKMKTICLIPPNIFGEGDNYDLKNSHVVAALVRKFKEAVFEGKKWVKIWGDGTAKREFMYVDDVVEAIIYFFKKTNKFVVINIGVGKDYSILELANLIAFYSGFKGKIKFDKKKPNGMKQKLLDNTRMKKYKFKVKSNFEENLVKTINYYGIVKE